VPVVVAGAREVVAAQNIENLNHYRFPSRHYS
jgi:hypothetical protein